VPLPIANPRGRSSIQYRIGTFTSFRRAMLDAVARPDLMATVSTSLAVDAGSTYDHHHQDFTPFRGPLLCSEDWHGIPAGHRRRGQR
jgi:hypothetical protein